MKILTTAKKSMLITLLMLIFLFSCKDGNSPTITTIRPTPKWPESIIAFWDFSESEAPFFNKIASEKFPLIQGKGSSAQKGNSDETIGPFGQGLVFDGKKDFLYIPSDSLRILNIGKYGQQVTVCAWVRTDDNDGAFIGGVWRENDKKPSRQYGLFMNLPAYGGRYRVCGHISANGGASKGIPYSRDYSSTIRTFKGNTWRFVAFSYDGQFMRSYLDGIMDSYTNYTEPGPPLGLSLTYDKNPYLFKDGLNTNSNSDFTVGSNEITSGMWNFLNGTIGGLAIFNKALSSEEIMRIHLDNLAKGGVILQENFYPDNGISANQLCAKVGWKSVRGNNATNTTNDLTSANFHLADAASKKQFYLFRGSGDVNSFVNSQVCGLTYLDSFRGLKISELKEISFTLNNSLSSDVVQLAVEVNGKWYLTSQQYKMSKDGAVASDWSTAENHVVTISRLMVFWKNMEFIPESVLNISDATLKSDIPDGEITSIGFYTDKTQGTIRIDNLKLVLK